MTDSLYHHGVKGQKWGIKNGPPYPIEKGYSKSLVDKPSSLTNNKEAVRLSETCNLPLKDKPWSIEDDLDAVNKSGRDRYGASWSNNCVKSSLCYSMRRMGLDVSADKVGFFDGILGGMTANEIAGYFKSGYKMNDIPREALNKSSKVEDTLKSYIMKECSPSESRACGIFGVSSSFGGHMMSWEKIGDDIIFTDPQSGSVDFSSKVLSFCDTHKDSTDITFSRIDNAIFDEKKVQKLVRR